MRRELVGRDEAPGGGWVDDLVQDIRSGAKPGFYLPPAEGGGLAFYARRGSMGFGHLHVEPGAGAPERGLALAARLIDALPPEVRALDLGLSGLSAEDEGATVASLALRPGSTVIAREALERLLGPEDAQFPAEPPHGTLRLAVRDVTVEALSDLDRRGFRSSVDALLVGVDPDDYRRSVETILGNGLGRFLDEASCAIVETDPMRLVGAILTAERSAHRGIFLDIVVDPERRRRGIGRYLLGWGLRALWALGYERVRLWASLDNAAARAMYAAFGFRRVGTATIYRWDRPEASPQPHRSR